MHASNAEPAPVPTGPCPAVLGCTYYVVVAWIWSLIWHMGLDPLKVRWLASCCAWQRVLPGVVAAPGAGGGARPTLGPRTAADLAVPDAGRGRGIPSAPRRHTSSTPLLPPPSPPPLFSTLQWIMMYMMDDEGFRSRGGGMFSNIFRMHGGWLVQLN